MLLNSYNNDFDNIIITSTDQNDWPSEIEDKNSLTLLISKKKSHVILQNQEQENMLKDIGFCHSWEIYPTNTEKSVIGYCYKNRFRCCKIAFKKLVHETVTGESIGNKIAEKIVKPKPISDDNSRMMKKTLLHRRNDKKY